MAEKTIIFFKRKKHFKVFLLVIVGIIVAIQAVLLVGKYLPELAPPAVQIPLQNQQNSSSPPLALEDYEKVEVKVSPSVIYLTSGCQQLAMVTTDIQSYSIQNGIDKKIDFRPTAHDMFKDLIDNFGIAVRMVKIESLEDSTYYSKLYVQQGNKLLGLDAKPSDSIAIAVRFDAPVYIAKTILRGSGKAVC